MKLHTHRLLLRDWQNDDLHAVRALAADVRVTRYQTRLRLETDDACRQWLADAITHNNADPRSSYSRAVVEQSTGRTVGWLNWGKAGKPSIAELSFGYALLPEVWNRGYMTEAVGAMLTFVFESQRRDSIYASCATSNRGSARVLEKAGLRLAHTRIERDEVRDTEEEHRCYILKRSDWRPASSR